MSATTGAESTPGILIPSLPNDIALHCLARVPRQYHPILAAVSKPIRSLLSSPDFFAARSALSCTEHLLYLQVRFHFDGPKDLFIIYGLPNPQSDKTNFAIGPLPGVFPIDLQRWSKYAAVGPKIYFLGGGANGGEVWIFDCRFHTWERGPSMLDSRGLGSTVVLDGKIYSIRHKTQQDSWIEVLDTVAGRWEALPGPKLAVYGERVYGSAVKGGKLCIWLKREELSFNPAAKTWDVFESVIGSGAPIFPRMWEVKGALCCLDHSLRAIKWFDERIGVWKMVNGIPTGKFPSRLHHPSTVSVGGRLIIMGLVEVWDRTVTSDWEAKVGVWCGEMDVEKDRNGDLRGKILWAETAYSRREWLLGRTSIMHLHYTCIPVSL